MVIFWKSKYMYNKTRMVGELNECLFKLRKPLADFICTILNPLFNNKLWEKQILEELKQKENYKKIIKQNNMETIYDLDISLLLYILLKYFNELKAFYSTMTKPEHFQYFGKFNDRYLTESIKDSRNYIAHINDKNLNVEVMKNLIDDFIKFGIFIGIDKNELRHLEIINSKYKKYQNNTVEEKEKNDRIKFIEDNVIRNALNNEDLDEDTRDSVLTTLFRLKIKKTAKEIDLFFIEAQEKSSRGLEVRDALHSNKLKSFEDIREEYEKLFIKRI